MNVLLWSQDQWDLLSDLCQQLAVRGARPSVPPPAASALADGSIAAGLPPRVMHVEGMELDDDGLGLRQHHHQHDVGDDDASSVGSTAEAPASLLGEAASRSFREPVTNVGRRRSFRVFSLTRSCAQFLSSNSPRRRLFAGLSSTLRVDADAQRHRAAPLHRLLTSFSRLCTLLRQSASAAGFCGTPALQTPMDAKPAQSRHDAQFDVAEQAQQFAPRTRSLCVPLSVAWWPTTTTSYSSQGEGSPSSSSHSTAARPTVDACESVRDLQAVLVTAPHLRDVYADVTGDFLICMEPAPAAAAFSQLAGELSAAARGSEAGTVYTADPRLVTTPSSSSAMAAADAVDVDLELPSLAASAPPSAPLTRARQPTSVASHDQQPVESVYGRPAQALPAVLSDSDVTNDMVCNENVASSVPAVDDIRRSGTSTPAWSALACDGQNTLLCALRTHLAVWFCAPSTKSAAGRSRRPSDKNSVLGFGQRARLLSRLGGVDCLPTVEVLSGLLCGSSGLCSVEELLRDARQTSMAATGLLDSDYEDGVAMGELVHCLFAGRVVPLSETLHRCYVRLLAASTLLSWTKRGVMVSCAASVSPTSVEVDQRFLERVSACITSVTFSAHLHAVISATCQQIATTATDLENAAEAVQHVLLTVSTSRRDHGGRHPFRSFYPNVLVTALWPPASTTSVPDGAAFGLREIEEGGVIGDAQPRSASSAATSASTPPVAAARAVPRTAVECTYDHNLCFTVTHTVRDRSSSLSGSSVELELETLGISDVLALLAPLAACGRQLSAAADSGALQPPPPAYYSADTAAIDAGLTAMAPGDVQASFVDPRLLAQWLLDPSLGEEALTADASDDVAMRQLTDSVLPGSAIATGAGAGVEDVNMAGVLDEPPLVRPPTVSAAFTATCPPSRRAVVAAFCRLWSLCPPQVTADASQGVSVTSPISRRLGALALCTGHGQVNFSASVQASDGFAAWCAAEACLASMAVESPTLYRDVCDAVGSCSTTSMLTVATAGDSSQSPHTQLMCDGGVGDRVFAALMGGAADEAGNASGDLDVLKRALSTVTGHCVTVHAWLTRVQQGSVLFALQHPSGSSELTACCLPLCSPISGCRHR